MTPLVVCLVGMLVVVGTILFLRLHAFLALLLSAVVVLSLSTLISPEYFENSAVPKIKNVPQSLINGFATGCGKVGIIIAFAAIIGQCLLESRAAEQIVKKIRAISGEKHAPKSFMLSGFLLGIPVFFDTVFYLLFPLVREYARKTKGTYLLCLLATVAGASMAHSLVPPTPGPLMVAAELNVSLGVLIPFGFILGLITISSGYLYAAFANRIWPLPLRSTLDFEDSPQTSLPDESKTKAPSFWIAILPILVPVVLIIIGSFTSMNYERTALRKFKPEIELLTKQYKAGEVTDQQFEHESKKLNQDFEDAKKIPPWMSLLTNKNMALGIGTILALILITMTGVRKGRKVEHVVRDALATGGVIILITAAGATFGAAMKGAGIAEQISGWASHPDGSSISGLLLLSLAFGSTVAVRVAQGSATVAMLTSVAIIAPIATATQLDFHPVYLVLAIGCGSKPGPWMNDSGFWIVSKMSGMTELETLRSFSVMLTVMGFVGFAVVLVAAKLFPFV